MQRLGQRRSPAQRQLRMRCTIAPMRCSTIHAFFETARRIPAQPAHLVRLAPGRWASLSWADAAAAVRRVARALVALGVQPGDRVALSGPNRVEWLHGY